MWMGKYRGYRVAVKVLRVYSTSNFASIMNVSSTGCRKTCFDQLVATVVGILQGGCDMERSSPSKYIATGGSDDERKPLCNGIRVDGAWEHQRIRQDSWGCEPV